MDTSSTMDGVADRGAHLLDKLTDGRFAFILLSFAVAIDAAVALIAHRNPLTVDWATLGAADFAKLGIAAVVYVFWMAVVSHWVRLPIDAILSRFRSSGSGEFLFCSRYRVASRNHGCKQYAESAGAKPLQRFKPGYRLYTACAKRRRS